MLQSFGETIGAEQEIKELFCSLSNSTKGIPYACHVITLLVEQKKTRRVADYYSSPCVGLSHFLPISSTPQQQRINLLYLPFLFVVFALIFGKLLKIEK